MQNAAAETPKQLGTGYESVTNIAHQQRKRSKYSFFPPSEKTYFRHNNILCFCDAWWMA